eukprot:m.78991 g.78991  ORF g.78991 m.78991 type:complete len:886 (+) comp14608_c0_seq1:127-2784(+)
MGDAEVEPTAAVAAAVDDGGQVPGEGEQELAEELSKVSITFESEPDDEGPEEDPYLAPERPSMDPADLPESYKKNAPKEEKIVAFCKNFLRQFQSLYSHRKPMFLLARNECGIEKFVSTTVRPTQLAYKELYTHAGISRFVANFLGLEFLDPPTDVPATLPSPTSTLWNQRGNVFDFSVLLCSLLQGAGYDAYCVSGYATREVCLVETIRKGNALAGATGAGASVGSSATVPADGAAAEPKKKNKYAMRPPKKLESKFDKSQAQRAAAKEAEAEARETAARAALETKHNPEEDPLFGLRAHCWVLVRGGKRDIPEPFFIEPSTGHSVSVKDPNYLGLEAIWNSRNYWVNLQKCTDGLGDVTYDIGDGSCWEQVFPDPDTHAGSAVAEQLHVPDITSSWVNKLSLSPQDFETRCPRGRKTIITPKSRIEIYAEYLREDGIVREETHFVDEALKHKCQVTSTFANRKDKLMRTKVTYDPETAHVQREEAYYAPGNPRKLREAIYVHPTRRELLKGGFGKRQFFFYANARVDGLVSREDLGTELTEVFEDREDRLVKRWVTFPGSTKSMLYASNKPGRKTDLDDLDLEPIKPAPSVFSPVEGERQIEVMHETYLRNPDVAADDDPAVLVYTVDTIRVTYHKDDARVTSLIQEFEKPQMSDKRVIPPITEDMVDTFQADPSKPPMKPFELQQRLEGLRTRQTKCAKAVRGSLGETKAILDATADEANNPTLEISFYDTRRNQEAKAHRQELERKARMEAIERQAMQQDYLAPFLIQLDDPKHISQEEAHWLMETCLQDLKDRLIAKAKLIEETFGKEKAALEEKQAWFQQEQESLTAEQHEEYVKFSKDGLFRIRILEKRLTLHKQEAPGKYVQLEQRLRNDPRIAKLL